MQDRIRELLFKIVSVFFFSEIHVGVEFCFWCVILLKKKSIDQEREREMYKKINKYLMTDDTNKIFNLFHFLTLKSSISKYIS